MRLLNTKQVGVPEIIQRFIYRKMNILGSLVLLIYSCYKLKSTQRTAKYVGESFLNEL